jgi:hypothetical protein
MPLGRDIPALSGFVCKLRGGSQPILAEATDGLRYVVKFGNQPQGPNLPFNESLGNELYRLAGLLVPACRPLEVSEQFIDDNRGCWLELELGMEPPQAGLCFGSCYLGTDGLRVYDILPGSRYPRVRNLDDFWLAWLLDSCAGHADSRQAVFCRGFDDNYSASFVDHGHMFGGPKGIETPRLEASAYLDRRIYPVLNPKVEKALVRRVSAIDCDRLWKRAWTLPANWRNPTASARLTETLDRLSSPSTIENTLGALIALQDHVYRTREHGALAERKPVVSVLRTGLRASRRRGLVVA